MIRIISGSAKGRRLLAPKNLPVRPTTDRAKEGLFNILQHQFSFENIVVVDLFSGTGNISYEFASRGVSEITAVEQNKKCIAFIDKTSKVLDFTIHTIQSDVIQYLTKSNKNFTFIFADPPYDWDYKAYEVLIDEAIPRLQEQGLLIIEHEKKYLFDRHSNWEYSRVYGNNSFSFFSKEKAGR